MLQRTTSTTTVVTLARCQWHSATQLVLYASATGTVTQAATDGDWQPHWQLTQAQAVTASGCVDLQIQVALQLEVLPVPVCVCVCVVQWRHFST